MSRLHRFVAAVALVALAPSLEAQAPPRRPRLARDADTNDATAYFQWGLDRLWRQPQQAAAAFYWAGRLDPASPQTLYAQHVAHLMSDNDRLALYMERDPRILRAVEVVRIDSLYLRALLLDPFVQTGLDEPLLVRYVQAAIARRPSFTGATAPSDGDIARAIDTVLAEINPYLRGILAYGRGAHREALHYYQRALGLRIGGVRIHAERARAFYHLRQLDSARAAMRTALELHRILDDVRPVFESKALWEYSLGRIAEEARDYAAAREAYQRALVEDLSHYPAHVRLGLVALAHRDTAAAIVELERALATHDDQYAVHATLGTVLARLGRREAAHAHLRRAAALEPWSSATWYLLGRELDVVNDTTGAVEAYGRFVALARRADPNLATVTVRLTRLREALQNR